MRHVATVSNPIRNKTFLDPWGVVGLRASSSVRDVPGKYGPHGELFFFLIKKEPFALTKAVDFKPFVPAETRKACALIGAHLMAAGGESGSLLTLWCLFAGAGWFEVPSVERRCILFEK